MPGFTRQIILHTLTELMNEKPLSKITVKDIVERCGVNRNTFYYHFRDIPDAVEAMVKEELNDILKDQKAPESVSDCMEILVNAVQKNKKSHDTSVPLDPEGCICRLSGLCRRACGGGADQQGGRRL